MQALILAAGMGKRLGELTQNNTKCMIKVNGITLIERMLRQLDSLKLNKIVIVIGYKGHNLIEFISGLKVSTKIEYVNNPIFDKTNNIYSLYLAKEHLLKDDTLLLESDLIFDDAVISKILNNCYPSLALISKYENWMDGTVVTIDEDDNIKRFIPSNQFLFEEIPTYFKTVNIYKFSKEFSSTHYVPFLEAYSKALGDNEYYEQVLRVITLLDKPEIKALKLENENWYEIDDIQDLDIAESVFAESSQKLKKIQKRFGGYWRYPKLKDFCYLVNPYFPNQKFKDEIKTNFDVLLTEYPSGQSVNSLLASKLFGINKDNIAVGNGAAELISALVDVIKEKVGVITPTFEEYPNRFSGIVEYFNLNNSDFSYGLEDIKKFYDFVNTLILINPDNPSGNYIKHVELINLLEWCKKRNKKLVVDESFIDFSDEGERSSLINNNILNTFPDLIVIKSISKSYGVPGCRLGIIASGNLEVINLIKARISIWNINSFGEFFLQIIGKYEKEYKEGCRLLVKERKRFFYELQKFEFIRVIPSQSNYFLCELKGNVSIKEFTEFLLSFNILIKDCSGKLGFLNGSYFRIAIRDRKDNDLFCSILQKLI